MRQCKTKDLTSCAPHYTTGSSVASQVPCGGAQWVCPEGSPHPLDVGAGYYGNEDADVRVRSRRILCPKGEGQRVGEVSTGGLGGQVLV
jgi:hypothetical protein